MCEFKQKLDGTPTVEKIAVRLCDIACLRLSVAGLRCILHLAGCQVILDLAWITFSDTWIEARTWGWEMWPELAVHSPVPTRALWFWQPAAATHCRAKTSAPPADSAAGRSGWPDQAASNITRVGLELSGTQLIMAARPL